MVYSKEYFQEKKMLETYKWAVMIHVLYTHSTWATMMTSWRFWLTTIKTEGIVLKVPLPHHWIAAPLYIWRPACTAKCSKAEGCKGTYCQYCSNKAVEDARDIAVGENNRVNSPNSTTWKTSDIKQEPRLIRLCLVIFNNKMSLKDLDVFYTSKQDEKKKKKRGTFQ